jgi:hypothetical protein
MGKAGTLPKAASGDAFRLDINALRALSVVAVVGFHFQIPGFAGGFVGVDVFLVITGYLMTAKVLNELKLGRFSPWTFWMMRQNPARFVDVPQATDGFGNLVRGVGGLRVAGLSEPWFSRKVARVPVTGRTGEKDQHAAG